MKKIKYLLIVLLILGLKNVYAIDECSTKEMQRLKELANNVEIKYDSLIEENWSVNDDEQPSAENLNSITVNYKLKIANYNDDLKFYIKLDNEDKRIINVNELEEQIFNENDNIQILVYAWTNNLCTGELLRTITIKLPVYNQFYYLHKEECSKNPDFKYCEEYLKEADISINDIEEEYESYLNKKSNVLDNNNKINIYYVVAGVVLVLIIVILINYIKPKKKIKKEKI